MSARRPSATVSRVARAAAVACSVLIAACAAPPNQATPPSSTATTSPSSAVSSGPLITVPGLSGSASSEPAPPASTQTPVPTPEPTPELAPERVITAEPPQSSIPQDAPAPAPAPVAEPAPAPAPGLVSGGKVVVIDPGHNGANAANPDIINALVPAGFGATKACNTTGTSTNDGYPEHAFTWGVAARLQSLLEARGITVIMTRGDDSGVGPCVNKRAAIGNDAHADLVLSIHGDGVNNESDTGFYVMTAERKPAGANIAARSDQLAVTMRDGLVAAGLSPSNYLGSNGLWQRGDLAGLNLSTRPTVMVESGNMRSGRDASLMSSAAGRQQFAQGYANGVLAFLAGAG